MSYLPEKQKIAADLLRPAAITSIISRIKVPMREQMRQELLHQTP
jgi:hypothetical protein